MTTLIRASGLQGYTTLMRSLGVDPAPLLRRHRIPSGSLTDEHAMMSLRSGLQLLEASAVETGCADFGLRLARMQDISVLGPLSIAIQNAPTIRQALDFAVRHLFVHSPGLVLAVHDKSSMIEGAIELTMEIRLERTPTQRQTIDLCLADLHNITKLLAADQYQLLAVSLPHRPVAPLSVYERFFGATVHAEQVLASLHVSPRTMRADLQGANHTLRKITEDYLARHFRGPGESVAARVRQAILHTLGTPNGRKADVAALLAIHPRTLQRHLAAEGLLFEAIREQTLKEVTLHYLHETDVPLGQLAAILGFSEQSALSRSCRRWFGAAPSVLRRRSSGAGSTS
jgi:AraC-like DNA-binding protein